MDELLQGFWQRTWLSFTVIAARLLLAAVLGAAVGFEREWRNRPAGLRTHLLICLTTPAVRNPHDRDHPCIRIFWSRDQNRSDPVDRSHNRRRRLPCGWAIFFAKGEVHGLTTGAGMWLAGAIGLAVGLGFWQVACFATLLAVVVLGFLEYRSTR